MTRSLDFIATLLFLVLCALPPDAPRALWSSLKATISRPFDEEVERVSRAGAELLKASRKPAEAP